MLAHRAKRANEVKFSIHFLQAYRDVFLDLYCWLLHIYWGRGIWCNAAQHPSAMDWCRGCLPGGCGNCPWRYGHTTKGHSGLKSRLKPEYGISRVFTLTPNMNCNLKAPLRIRRRTSCLGLIQTPQRPIGTAVSLENLNHVGRKANQ